MQVLLRHSDNRRDIECSICKQGFQIYWERTSPAERDTMRAIVMGELAHHHNGSDRSSDAHPSRPFNLPEWSGDHQFSGAALLGGLSGLQRVTRTSRPHR